MAWYRAGTVTVTNGSATVTGAGTDFVSFASSGDAFRGPDGRSYEIARIVSATELTLAEPYVNGTGGGQPFAIQPTQSYIRDLALNAGTLLTTFGGVRDGIGQGLIGDGSQATPGIRFTADPDTGLFRFGANALGIAAGGKSPVWIEPTRMVLRGTGEGNNPNATGAERVYTQLHFVSDQGFLVGGITAIQPNGVFQDRGAIRISGSAGPGLTMDVDGNMIVGTTSGAYHTIMKSTPERQKVLGIAFAPGEFAHFRAQQGAGGSAANATFWLNAAADTGRSINAGGTVNASGADYAEYMTKADGCGTIAAGDICGVDRDGKLTRTWADAVGFVVKSTDPAYVGGDSWAQHLPPQPEAPGAEPVAPIAPDLPSGEDGDAALAAWRSATAAYSASMAAFPAARAAWQAEADAHARDLAAWEAALEAERVKVDRIAFCGQVPVNVTGDFAVGDYLIAAAAGAGIKAVAVAGADITFDQYRRRLGKVWAVRDGRAWVDVQHG